MIMTDFKDKFAVLVVSCDKYSDMWSPFFTLFWRFWSDCPFKVYLLSNNVDFNMPKVSTIKVGDDRSWSDTLLECLIKIREPYIMLFLEDLLLVDYVDTDRVLEVFRWIDQHKSNYVRLHPFPKPDKYLNPMLGKISKGTVYRTGTITSVWNKNILMKLIN